MRVIAIIPARYGSTRFPGKALADINGKPMVQHVYERAARARCTRRVLVATDDERIARVVSGFGGEAVMTRKEHQSGTDRIAEAARDADVDIVLNVQGDEPMLEAEMLDELVELLSAAPDAGIATLVREVHTEVEFTDPGVVKTVIDPDGYALYFSRSLIPYPVKRTHHFHVYEHIGLYGYRKECLLRFAGLPPSPLEEIEALEQLRALENGIRIRVGETRCRATGVSVDTPADLEKVCRLLAEEQVEEPGQ